MTYRTLVTGVGETTELTHRLARFSPTASIEKRDPEWKGR